ncbi:unnamed protein product [Didymodactylos carnosus]|uniref:Cation efflux protein transmembrane domain-containing protein n=1 Tax=Didymodactylos carnosus TaxID=1234261 RepID=A0A814J4Y1_9BILA|nr:unnamed protein product [Didymodactylos carnosus]CAF1285784.1 unnamed protein product [Didymodactylos carnosus]CAF3804139.1 unnamed protein product [Didymodactylos carnosus]CAF4090778.1 unnamed protein product [Didymodactylos carnosus]
MDLSSGDRLFQKYRLQQRRRHTVDDINLRYVLPSFTNSIPDTNTKTDINNKDIKIFSIAQIEPNGITKTDTVQVLAKIFSAVFSKSLSIASSAIDSTIDLMLNFAIWWAARAIQKRNPYAYPQGRTRLEPIIIIILSVVMCLASVQVIYESVHALVTDIKYFTKKNSTDEHLTNIDISAAPITIMCITIVVKIILSAFCYQIATPTMVALAQDHRNDVVSTVVALVFGLIASKAMNGSIKEKKFVMIDPIGAIIISLYIIVCWMPQARLHIRNLTGYTAHPKFLQQITWLAFNHSPLITKIDAVRAYHFGNHYLVEVDIILPKNMFVKDAVEIETTLQKKIENLREVERAFVQLHYSIENPEQKHKIV